MITNPRKFLKKKIFGHRDLRKEKKISRFQKKVYKILKRVPKGKVTTYKKIAKKLKTSPRAVGNALNKNPTPGTRKDQFPCHRVIKTNGEVGGFASGTRNKIKLLKKEGIKIEKGKINLEKYGFNYD